jgi:hypothetical protein
MLFSGPKAVSQVLFDAVFATAISLTLMAVFGLMFAAQASLRRNMLSVKM